MRSRAPWPAARALCWWSTLRRASRRRPWRMPTLAINNGLDMIPVINKIDLPSADILRTQEMIESAMGVDATDAVPVSAKTGLGVPEVLEAIVRRLPPPVGDAEAPLQALIFDCWFDPYRGVIVLVA